MEIVQNYLNMGWNQGQLTKKCHSVSPPHKRKAHPERSGMRFPVNPGGWPDLTVSARRGRRPGSSSGREVRSPCRSGRASSCSNPCRGCTPTADPRRGKAASAETGSRAGSSRELVRRGWYSRSWRQGSRRSGRPSRLGCLRKSRRDWPRAPGSGGPQDAPSAERCRADRRDWRLPSR